MSCYKAWSRVLKTCLSDQLDQMVSPTSPANRTISCMLRIRFQLVIYLAILFSRNNIYLENQFFHCICQWETHPEFESPSKSEPSWSWFPYRGHVDANRDKPEGTQACPQAETAWDKYHRTVDEAVKSLGGQRGLLLDFHGQVSGNFLWIFVTKWTPPKVVLNREPFLCFPWLWNPSRITYTDIFTNHFQISPYVNHASNACNLLGHFKKTFQASFNFFSFPII